MAICTRCGAQITEGVPHECSEAPSAVAATSATDAAGSGAAQASGAAQWFNGFVQYVKLGIKDPDALSSELQRSGDLVSVIVLYLIPGFLLGIFSVLFIKKAISSIIDALGLGSAFYGILSMGGIDGYSGFGDSFPWFSIILKSLIQISLFGASYALSYFVLAQIFKGKGSLEQYFRAFAAAAVPVSLALLVGIVLVNLSLTAGILCVLVALLYASFFPFLQARQISGFSVAKSVYSLPLAHVIPLLVFYILGKLGL